MHITGARIVVESLIRQGVDTVFGIPGGNVLPVFDELFKRRARIRLVMTAHEQGAAHAADGYARAGGKAGVCLATSGPGASNLVTGIAAAYMDSSPMVIVTGNVPSALLGTDCFQEIDIAGMTASVTKYGWIVKRAEDIARTLDEAFALALEGRPGPVLVDITKDALTARAAYGENADAASPVKPPVRESDLRRASEIINAAHRPLILAGGGVSEDAAPYLAALAEKIKAPVSMTLMGLGAVPHDHPMRLGNIGMHGNRASNSAAARCDLLLAVGTRFADRNLGNAEAYMPDARVIHIDIDRAEKNKNVLAHTRVLADARGALEGLLPLVRGRSDTSWLDELLALRTPNPSTDAGLFHPCAILRELRDALGPDAVIATDVGQHQMWTARYYPFDRPKRLITSGGLGAMGFGLGAAIGAKLAHPERPVALVTGDGSFRMNLIELATVSGQGLPLTVLVLNNGVYGMIRQLQTCYYGKRYAASSLTGNPDFASVARAYGLRGARAVTIGELRAALGDALRSKAATVIDVQVSPDELVRPMVGPGDPIDQFTLT